MPGQAIVSWPAHSVEVRVPATSANLGPGFDAMGLALARYDVVTARVTSGGLAIEVSGEGAGDAPAGEQHLVVRAMRAAFGVLGVQPPGISLRCVNAIPQGRGLGSSAAAIVSGLLAARTLAAGAHVGLADPDLLRLAVALEGHPDNVSACLAGDLVISWTSASGARFARLATAAALAPVLCVSDSELSTSAARQALPESVPHRDAAANSARAALLVTALTGDLGLLMDATEDFLHQRYRAASMPGTAALVGALRAGGIPAVVSGAGPAVLALTIAGRQPGPREVAAVAAELDPSWRVTPVAVDSTGAVVSVPGDT
jgi:homoserine kinase